MTTTPQAQTGGDVTENGKGGKGLLMAGIGIGAAALIGGGAWAAVNFMGGGGDQPDSVLPADAALYARIDMDPGAGQKVAAVRFFQGLDEDAKARLDKGEWREYVWEKLNEEGGNPAGLDYEKDIEPWLGDRLGFALMAGGDGEEPLPVVAMQVKDGQKALETMDKLKAAATEEPMEMDYWVADDYLVMTAAGKAETVKAAVESGTLADVDTYKADMKDLGDPGIASYWYDVERFVGMADELSSAAEGTTELGAPAAVDGISSALTEEQKALMKGRNAGTVRLNADSIEIYGIGRSANGLAMPVKGDSARIVNDLPADTVAAFSLENGGDWVQSVWDALGKMDPEGLQKASEEASAQGFTLPDDIKTVLGDSMSLSVGPGIVQAANTMDQTTDTGMPPLPIAYRVQTDATKVNTLLSNAGLPPTAMAQRTDDGVLTLGLHQPYVDGVAATKDRLGDNSAYKAAVADADKAMSVFFVNVNEFEKDYLPLVDDENARKSLEALGTVGYSAVADSATDSHFTLRLVADEK